MNSIREINTPYYEKLTRKEIQIMYIVMSVAMLFAATVAVLI